MPEYFLPPLFYAIIPIKRMYNFHDHAAMIRIIGEMESFCRETGIRDINEIIGCV